MPKKPTPPEDKRLMVRLDLDPTAHAELRLAAAREGVPMSVFAREAVAEAASRVNQDAAKKAR